MPWFNLAAAKIAAAVGVAFVLALLSIVLILVIIHGAPSNGQQVISLIGTIALLGGILANLLGVGGLIGATSDMQKQLNGHLDAHVKGMAGPPGPQGEPGPQGPPGATTQPNTIVP
jgi:hypothetical protein